MRSQFFFTWVNPGQEVFDLKNLREDLKVLDLEIKEHEGVMPRAILRVPNDGSLHGFLNHEIEALIVRHEEENYHLLFRGRLSSLPLSIKGETIVLELIAEPIDQKTQLEQLCGKLKAQGHFEPLFLKLENQEIPALKDLLEGCIEIPFWSRHNSNLSLTSIYGEGEPIHFKGKHLYDSLSIGISQEPISEIEVQVTARWKQIAQNNCRLDHVIQGLLPTGMISSLTGGDLELSWWKDGGRLKNTGYHIESTHLEKIIPPRTGVLNMYPRLSKPLVLSPQDPLNKSKDLKKVRLKCQWYRPRLKVGWTYRQRRFESAHFTLRNDLQTFGWSGRRRVLKLSVNLGRGEEFGPWVPDVKHFRGQKVAVDKRAYVCLRDHRSDFEFLKDAGLWHDLGPIHQLQQLSFGEFFTRDRGYQLLQRALEIAASRLAISSRALEVSFECPLDCALNWSLKNTIILEDHRLPGGQAAGKIKTLQLKICGDTGEQKARITLACSIGTGKTPVAVEKLERETNGYLDTDCPVNFLPGPTIERIVALGPTVGHAYPEFLGASDLIQELVIRNDMSEQEAYLLEQTYPKGHNLMASLKDVKTQLKLVLGDLRSIPIGEKRYRVEISGPWAAPQQINFNK